MTKPDKSGHIEELSVEQCNAIDLLVTGAGDAEVAAAVGKTRQTVCGWRLHHPTFQSELNRRRHEVWGAATDKLRALLPKALATLERELEGGNDAVRVAIAIMKMASLPISTIGSQSEEEITLAEAERQSRAMFANLGLDLTAARKELLVKAHEHDRDI